MGVLAKGWQKRMVEKKMGEEKITEFTSSSITGIMVKINCSSDTK